MSLEKSIDSKFNDLKLAIDSERGKWISSQGVNALIVVYPPKEEKDYISRVKNDYGNEYIIDLSELFVSLIDNVGLDMFKIMYKNFKSNPERIFNNEGSDQPDLFKSIIGEIRKAKKQDKMPIIIRTGILYGTQIRNNQILEHRVVSELNKPLIIFYPGEIVRDVNEKERVLFLGVQKASDYRGQLI